MVGNRVVVVAALMGCVGCTSKPTAEPTVPPRASPAASAASVAPDKVTADVRDDDRGLFAVIEVHVGGEVHTVELTSDFQDCEGSEAIVEEVALNDDRLRMVQLFCENGEDVFTRRMITALLLADPTPRILWKGSGSFTNEFDSCSRIDVLSFRRASSGQVEAVRTVEVSVGDGGEENDECVAAPAKDTVLATIEVPGTAVTPAAPKNVQAPKAEAPIEWSSRKNKVGACTGLVLEARRAGEVVATKTWKDECETCNENACTSTMHERGDIVKVQDHSFVWIETVSDWGDNAMVDLELWGYECGKLVVVWAKQHSPADKLAFTFAPVDSSWTSLLVKQVQWQESWDGKKTDVEEELLPFEWDADRCRFVVAH